MVQTTAKEKLVALMPSLSLFPLSPLSLSYYMYFSSPSLLLFYSFFFFFIDKVVIYSRQQSADACSQVTSNQYSFTYIAHPRAITGFVWRKTSIYMKQWVTLLFWSFYLSPSLLSSTQLSSPPLLPFPLLSSPPLPPLLFSPLPPGVQYPMSSSLVARTISVAYGVRPSLKRKPHNQTSSGSSSLPPSTQ